MGSKNGIQKWTPKNGARLRHHLLPIWVNSAALFVHLHVNPFLADDGDVVLEIESVRFVHEDATGHAVAPWPRDSILLLIFCGALFTVVVSEHLLMMIER